MKFLLVILLSIQCVAQNFEDKALSFVIHELTGYHSITMKILNHNYDKENIQIDTSKRIILNKDIVMIPVLIQNEKKSVNTFISAKVKLFKNVLVAKRNIKKNEIVSSNDFEHKLLDICKLNGNTVGDNFNLTAFRAKAFIKKGEILIEEKLDKIPIINYGDKICAEVKVGSVTITTNVFARQSGNMGDIISIVSSDNTILKAKIIDKDKVRIE